MVRTARLFVATLLIALGLAAPAQKWRFVVTGDGRGGDNGINARITAELAKAIVAEKPDLLLFSGDLVLGDSDAKVFEKQLIHWRAAMEPVYNAGVKVFAVMGNHEWKCKTAPSVWRKVFSGRYTMPQNGPSGEKDATFWVRHKNALLVGLDVEGSHPYRVNQAWLNQVLKQNREPHVFVMTHMPAFKVHHTDTLADHPADRAAFWKSLAAAGAQVYFCGHDHFYDHLRIDGREAGGLHQFIVGTAGAPFYPDDNTNGNNGGWTPVRVFHERQYGYVVVDVDGRNATVTWKHRVKPGVYEPGGDTYVFRAPETSTFRRP